jgi:hypothetical protein
MVAEFPHVAVHQSRLAMALRQLAEVDIARGQKDKAQADLNEALGVVDALAKNSAGSSPSTMVGMQYRMLARTFRTLGNQTLADELEAKAGPLPEWGRGYGSFSNRGPTSTKDEAKETTSAKPE